MCTQTAYTITTTRTLKHFISNYDNYLVSYSTTSPVSSYTWPINNGIYFGRNTTSSYTTPIGLGIKNFMFLNYYLTKPEHLYMPMSEYNFKRAAIFYFTMTDGMYPGLTNGMIPY
jgi:hypothetical protein